MARTQYNETVYSVSILTAGGDCPGLNAVTRAIGKASAKERVEVFSFVDSFNGLIENRQFDRMGSKEGQDYNDLPLRDLLGKTRKVMPDHPIVKDARAAGTCLGDEN